MYTATCNLQLPHKSAWSTWGLSAGLLSVVTARAAAFAAPQEGVQGPHAGQHGPIHCPILHRRVGHAALSGTPAPQVSISLSVPVCLLVCLCSAWHWALYLAHSFVSECNLLQHQVCYHHCCRLMHGLCLSVCLSVCPSVCLSVCLFAAQTSIFGRSATALATM